jgi:hypothetical protein
VLNRGELIVLPPIYWLAKQLLDPTYGPYADYNKFRMGVPAALAQIVDTSIYQLKEGVRFLIPARAELAELGLAAAMIIALFAAAAWIRNLPLKTRDENEA